MSGGIAYVLDPDGLFRKIRCNRELVDLEALSDPTETEQVLRLLRRHQAYTGSPVAQRVLDSWEQIQKQFVKVMPRDYKRALERLQSETSEAGVA